MRFKKFIRFGNFSLSCYEIRFTRNVKWRSKPFKKA